MRIGVFAGDVTSRGAVHEILADARRAANAGFPSFWLPQILGLDAMTMASAIAREVPSIEIGTAVVPSYPRHPVALAQQALTTNSLAAGRFTLGIGPSHRVMVEQVLGLDYANPVQHLREYLSILRPLVHDRAVTFRGTRMNTSVKLDASAAEPFPILIAALQPKMLELAGELADGTITWMTGPETIANHIVPNLYASAEQRSRPRPRVVAGVPICVTDDIDGTRALAAEVFRMYGKLPAYRAMLDRESLAGPADLALIGDEECVRDGMERFAAAGVDDLLTVEFGRDADQLGRTRALLQSRLQAGATD